MILAAAGLGLVLVAALTVVGLLARDATQAAGGEGIGEAEETGGAGEARATEEGGATKRRHDGDVAIFLCDGRSCPEISDQQRSELAADLEAHALVADLEYESKEQAYQRFLVLFEDRPDVLESTDPDALPAAFRVWVEDPQQAGQLVGAFETRPGVEAVIVNVGTPVPGEDPPDAAWADDDIASALASAPVLTIFLCTGQVCDEPSTADRAQLESDLDAHPQVTRFEYESQEEAYERLLKLFEGQETLTDVMDPSTTPASYRVWVDDPVPFFEDPSRARELAEAFEPRPGVDEVVDALEPSRHHLGN